MINKGMTLVEVMIALIIIVVIAMVAYQYHSLITASNHDLLLRQESLLSDENEFDQAYSMEI